MIVRRQKRLSRRTVLRGAAGVMLGLPMLEAMLPTTPASAHGGGVPRRFVGMFLPNGLRPEQFWPATGGADYPSTPLLDPLAAVRGEFNVIGGLTDTAYAGTTGLSNHMGGCAGFLTAMPAQHVGSSVENGTSLDQVYGDAVGTATKLKTIQLGADPQGERSCDFAPCSVSDAISWRRSTPQPILHDPQVAFELIFGDFEGGSPDDPELARRREDRVSVLDYVSEQTLALQAKLGTTDRAKVEEYLDSVRELEQRIHSDVTLSCTSAPSASPPLAALDRPALMRVMLDLVVLSLACDATRSVTFMQAVARSDMAYPFLGAPGSHHNYSHSSNSEELLAIETWEMEQLAYLLAKLREAEAEDGSALLDHCIVYCGPSLGDGRGHTHDNIPIIVGGRGGGAFDTGRYVVYDDEPVANLLTTILQALGVESDAFGVATGPLSGLS